MNTIPIPQRFLLPAAWALLVIAGLVTSSRHGEASTSDKVLDTRVRPVPFEVVEKLLDGPWLVPTLRTIRSEREWNAAMDQWQARREVAGRQAPPKVDWTRQSVVVLSLGTQPRRYGVSVQECRVEGEDTIVELRLSRGEQWDPYYVAEHPSMVIAFDRSDLKNVKLICDAVIDGLPGSAGRARRDQRSGTPVGTGAVAGAPQALLDAAPNSANVQLDGESGATTWGRLKVSYRGTSPSH